MDIVKRDEHHPGDTSNELRIRFKDQNGTITSFTFSKYEKMRRVFRTYAAKVQMDHGVLAFHLNNKRIPHNSTLKMLEIKPVDFISVKRLSDQEIRSKEQRNRERLRIGFHNNSSGDSHPIYYKIHPTSQFRSTFGAYALEIKQSVESLEFHFKNNVRLLPEHTPKMHEMKNNDEITVTCTESSANIVISSASNDNRDEEKLISISLRSQFGEETRFSVRLKANMEKVFKAYADSKGISVDSLRFLLDGMRLKYDHTPKMLELQDGDQIDVVSEQEGG